eukprot:scaffold784_cov125-Isochrysis_galbana.AAC.2
MEKTADATAAPLKPNALGRQGFLVRSYKFFFETEATGQPCPTHEERGRYWGYFEFFCSMLGTWASAIQSAYIINGRPPRESRELRVLAGAGLGARPYLPSSKNLPRSMLALFCSLLISCAPERAGAALAYS